LHVRRERSPPCLERGADGRRLGRRSIGRVMGMGWFRRTMGRANLEELSADDHAGMWTEGEEHAGPGTVSEVVVVLVCLAAVVGVTLLLGMLSPSCWAQPYEPGITAPDWK